MTRLPRLSVFAAALLAAACSGMAAAGTVSIELAGQGNQSVRLSYRVPPGVRALDLWQNDDAAQGVWREMVHSLDDCAHVEAGRLIFRATCRVARFSIQPASLNRDATYEAAQAVGGQGVLLHSAFYAATAPGHALQWRWVPPAGGYSIESGQLSRQARQVLVPAQAVDAARREPQTLAAEEALLAKRHIYLGRAAVLELPGGVLVRDPQLDAVRERAIVDMLSLSLSGLRKAYGRAPQGPVAVIPVTEDRPGWHGDTDGHRMMRLQLDRDQRRVGPLLDLQHFVAHEVAHWWNAGVYHSDAGRAWLHEGHADWLALLLTQQAGLRSAGELQATIAQAVADCQSLRDETPAVRLPKGRGAGKDAYQCGMALWALAHLGRMQPGQDALHSLAAAHQRPAGVLTEAGFADWADDGAAGPWHTLLLDERQGFRSGFVKAWSVWAEQRQAQASADLNRGQRMQLAAQLMASLMRADCQGQVGFWTLQDAFRTDTVPACQQIKGEQEVVSIAGEAPIERPMEAWAAARALCEGTEARLPLGLRSGGSWSLACPSEALQMPAPALWQLHADVATRLGLKPRNE